MGGKYFYIGIVLLILFFVAISGCTDSNAILMNNTFSNGGLTFKYPSTFVSTNPGSDEMLSGSPDVQILGYLADNNNKGNTTIEVRKLPIPSYTVESVYNLQRASYYSINFLPLTNTRTTVNGITVYKFIFNGTSPISGNSVKGYQLVFGKDNDVAYGMILQGPANDFNRTNNIEQQLEPTIQLQ